MDFREVVSRVRSGVPRRLGRLRRRAIRSQLIAGRFRSRSVEFGPQTGREALVVMCLWNRPSRAEVVLDMLDAQDFPEGVNLYLWNNNRADHSHYVSVLNSYRATGALRKVSLAKSPYNLGSIGRFYWARKLSSVRPGSPLIVIDDDQDFGPEFVSAAMGQFDPGAVKGWWAWTVVGTYHARIAAEVGDQVDHVGPGGSVSPIDIFSDARFFTDIPDQFRMLDDLWLTCFAKRAGYRLEKLPVEIDFVMHETNQFFGQVDLKTDFYNYLYK